MGSSLCARARKHIVGVGTSALLGWCVIGCGGPDKPAAAPTNETPGGAKPGENQVGGTPANMEGAGTSGLTGSAKSAYEAGWQAYLRGDLPTAKKQFQEAASLDTKSGSPHYSLGVVNEHLGDTPGAQQSYRMAFANSPDHEVAMCAYALSLALQSNLAVELGLDDNAVAQLTGAALDRPVDIVLGHVGGAGSRHDGVQVLAHAGSDRDRLRELAEELAAFDVGRALGTLDLCPLGVS